jgi:hypothetical protein
MFCIITCDQSLKNGLLKPVDSPILLKSMTETVQMHPYQQGSLKTIYAPLITGEC